MRKINIAHYIKNNKLIQANEERSQKWDKKFLEDFGVFDILNNDKLTGSEQLELLKLLIDSLDNSLEKYMLYIMLFNLEFNSQYGNAKYTLSYNGKNNCFFILRRTSAIKTYIYVTREIVENIILNEIQF